MRELLRRASVTAAVAGAAMATATVGATSTLVAEPAASKTTLGPGASSGCGQGAGTATCPVLFQLGPDNLSDAATGLAPGDTASRTLDISNDKGGNLSSISLTVEAAPSTPALVSSSAQGLQLQMTRCSQPWTVTGPRSYRCDGTSQWVLTERAVLVRSVSLQNLASLKQGGRDHVLVRLRLPDSDDLSLMRNASSLTYGLTATTRTGRS